jgi:hypothetical protein
MRGRQKTARWKTKQVTGNVAVKQQIFNFHS